MFSVNFTPLKLTCDQVDSYRKKTKERKLFHRNIGWKSEKAGLVYLDMQKDWLLVRVVSFGGSDGYPIRCSIE